MSLMRDRRAIMTVGLDGRRMTGGLADPLSEVAELEGDAMTFVGWWQIAIVLALVVVTAIPVSSLIADVYAGKENFLSPVLRPVERGFYLLAGVDEKREQSWFIYAIAMIAFSIAGFLSLYALQRLQNVLPLNPQGFDAVPADLAFNTSISFITNTNWQNYGGETTMSYLTPDARPHRA